MYHYRICRCIIKAFVPSSRKKVRCRNGGPCRLGEQRKNSELLGSEVQGFSMKGGEMGAQINFNSASTQKRR